MDEMVDRVAKAIGQKFNYWLETGKPLSHKEVARAAIEAMRDVPDWLMMVGGNTPISNVGPTGAGRKGRIGDIAAREAFERMIDASLNVTASDIPTPLPT